MSIEGHRVKAEVKHEVTEDQCTNIKVEFENVQNWVNRYQRNNKRNGLKNLRCFPYCGDSHKDKGYCGSAVRIKVIRPKKTNLAPLYAWSEFRRTKRDPTWKVGEIVPLETLTKLERSKENPTLPLYRGDVGNCMDFTSVKLAPNSLKIDHEDMSTLFDRSDSVCTFEFNRLRRGWNYSWAANKHTCNELHALTVYLFVPLGENSFQVVMVQSSPAFQVFCRKRPPRKNENSSVETAKSTPATNTTTTTRRRKNNVGDVPDSDHIDPSFYVEETLSDPSFLPLTQQKNSHPSSLSQPQIQHPGSFPSFNNNNNQKLQENFAVNAPLNMQPFNQYQNVPLQGYDLIDDVSCLGGLLEQAGEGFPEYGLDDFTITKFDSKDQKEKPIPETEPQVSSSSNAVNKEEENFLFRTYFLDSFWNDEGLTDMTAFDPSTAAAAAVSQTKRQRDHRDEAKSVFEAKKSFDDLSSDGSSTLPDEPPINVPAPLPLRELMNREESYRQDPPPPPEVANVFGMAEDTDEERTNARLWRLVLVLALVEAHWCEQQQLHAEQELDCALKEGEFHHKQPELAWKSHRRPSVAPEFYPKMSSDNRAIVANLATFLIEEQMFTRSIADALTSLGPDAPLKESKSAFIRVAHIQIGYFCESHNISLAQFERLFDDEPSLEFLKHAATRLQLLQDTMRTYRDMVKVGSPDQLHTEKRCIKMNDAPVFNGSGTYEMDEELLEAHACIREMRGIPWVLRKMIRYIEQSFTIEQNGYQSIVMQGNRKLMSNGVNVYITDGERRRFTMQSPVPWSRPLATFYEAWFVTNPLELHIVHYHGDFERVERVITHTNSALQMEITFETLENNVWTMQFTGRGFAKLIRPGPGFNIDWMGQPPPVPPAFKCVHPSV